jgi:hypothetical protein
LRRLDHFSLREHAFQKVLNEILNELRRGKKQHCVRREGSLSSDMHVYIKQSVLRKGRCEAAARVTASRAMLLVHANNTSHHKKKRAFYSVSI